TDGSLLITIQAHKNTVAVASLAEIPAILICGNKHAPPEMLEAAQAENVAILRTSDNQYTASWKVHEALE
ncbi:MAG: iron-sulfur binding hydrogenase, partial [Chitinivibrionales bacterium]|nr:iron-sulfur binding hydrogenase [Chitinivibrionales bacterium]MBD3357132.1 iron-sulfur binding hydrogenase [Chitinivibrionales bacterium]